MHDIGHAFGAQLGGQTDSREPEACVFLASSRGLPDVSGGVFHGDGVDSLAGDRGRDAAGETGDVGYSNVLR